MRTRDQARKYFLAKLDQELPASRVRGMELAYRLFGLLPDTLQLKPLLADLYTEQVAGYYEPDSAMLFGVEGADPLQLRIVMAHELVHALQGQYLPLDSILHDRADNDRATAAQSILEGQAMLVAFQVTDTLHDFVRDDEIWQRVLDATEASRSTMPVFARAPLILQESLLFPYMRGMGFMRWWERSKLADTVPFGPRMPKSSEQILFPDRYARGDAPVVIAFEPDTAVAADDVLGEFEIRVLEAQLLGHAVNADPAPLGWGGDRYRVYDSPAGPALVWYTVWDDRASAQRFERGAGLRLATTTRPGYRATLDTLTLDRRPALRFVLAPGAWPRWSAVPGAAVR